MSVAIEQIAGIEMNESPFYDVLKDTIISKIIEISQIIWKQN